MSDEQNFLTIKENGENEIVIKKSRFITNIARTETKQEAEDFIKKISKQYRDATHNTYAFTIGLNDEIQKASDNGEPSGTAGIPELKALLLMNLKNVTAVVTRYFGGIKLGAGGLIRAYSNSVTEACEQIGIVKRVLQQEIIFSVAYNRFDEINHFLEANEIYVENKSYAAEISISVYLDLDQVDAFKKSITNLLAGKVSFSKGNQRYNEILLKNNDFHEQ